MNAASRGPGLPASDAAAHPDSRLRARRRRRNWRLVSATGARVVHLRRLSPKARARAMLPSLFTLGNMVCGFSSVLLSFQGKFRIAAVLIAISILLDICDGAVARAVGAISAFGLQFDSLADLISFGVAPAVLVYTWALPQYPVTAWFGAMFWLACAAYRLARFNVTIDPLADKRYFIGLPSPGAAGVVIATVLAIQGPLYGHPLWLPIAAGVVPAALMATSFRFRSFRNLVSLDPWWGTAIFAVLLVVGLIFVPGLTGMVVAMGYVLTCPLGWITAPIRRRLFGPDSVAPPRHKMPSVLLPTDPDDSDDDTDDDEVDFDPEETPAAGLGTETDDGVVTIVDRGSDHGPDGAR